MKPRRLKFFFMGAALGGIFLTFCLATSNLVLVRPQVIIFSHLLTGKESGAWEDFLAEKEKEILGRKVVFLRPQASPPQWEITPSMIDFSLDKDATMKKILASSKAEGGITHLWEIGNLFQPQKKVLPEFKFSEKKLAALTDQVGLAVNRSAQEALFEFKPASPAGGEGRVTSFRPSLSGWQLQTKDFKEAIIDYFSRPDFEESDWRLPLPVREILPKITTDQSNNLGIREILATGESFFLDSIPSRVYNIALAASRLHGIVIPPGETFSFAQSIGEISAATGYQQAYVIKEKRTILEDGGGVCQVSTTLFRAALNAGLPMVERQAHYYRVGFYEQGGYPPGLDATVYPPSPDLKFKNDTGAYVLIQAVVDKTTKRLVFELYGTADGRRTELTKPVIHSQTPPPEPLYVDEPTLPAGTVKRIDTAHWGAKVSFRRQVFTAAGELKEDRTFWSTYVPWPAVYQRGVGQ